MHQIPRITEKYISQFPAVKLLVNSGYEYISIAEANRNRGGKTSNFLLESILAESLRKINRIRYKGGQYQFSESNIQSAVLDLKQIKYEGKVQSNKTVYDLLTLGCAFEQTIGGDTKSFTMKFIDFEHPERNNYHIAVEYAVERMGKTENIRPDIVLFVNGIPLSVIECKALTVDADEAIDQMIRNQGEEYSPLFFAYSQLLLAVNKNEAKYGTVGTEAKFWGVWKEDALEKDGRDYPALQEKINLPLPKETFKSIAKDLEFARDFEDTPRSVTDQDKAVYALCRPERLLEIALKFTVFDGNIKKVARYQQYFVVKNILDRIEGITDKGRREGGMVWQTQGSGKSLTMVMLAKNLALEKSLTNPRIILVTDRTNLDKQLRDTFKSCGMEPKRAATGKDLLKKVAEGRTSIITTVINKFETAYQSKKYQDESRDIFVIVDEGHRTQFGSFASKMRHMFPNAAYLGFTGTPLTKKDKNNFEKFGGLIKPYYSVNQAVEDGAVVPLLYESRHVDPEVSDNTLDLWFDRLTENYTKEQKADLKRRTAKAELINKTSPVIKARAFDIAEHYAETFQGTGFKAQLVAPDRVTALKYKEHFDEAGKVKAEVIMSTPEKRKDKKTTPKESDRKILTFWENMMERYGSEKEYTDSIISDFNNEGGTEIIIVIDKLLTGFDAPRNTVLYLTRILREHTLLQAIARVNRLFKGKDFGYVVDYAGVLGELDKALTMYDALEGFDEEDMAGTLTSINEEVETLPAKYTALWDMFKTIKNKADEHEYQEFLADQALREEFYSRLTQYGKTLTIALSSQKFLAETDTGKISRYKKDFKFFQKLRYEVKRRYADSVDYGDIEPQILKLFDNHMQAGEVMQLIEPVNIFDEETFAKVVEENTSDKEKRATAAKADSIAHQTKKVINEKMEEDPALYDKLSKMLADVINDYRDKRISDIEYLNQAVRIAKQVKGQVHENVPEALKDKAEAQVYYGNLLKIESIFKDEAITTDTALAIDDIFKSRKKINFWNDDDAINAVKNDIDDYFYDILKEEKGIEFSVKDLDEVIDKVLKIAKSRSK